MRLAAFLLATCAVAPLAAGAATLKPFSTLPGPVVRLSDIWDGVAVDKPLGPAPAPGGRITVPAAQLAAIARDFGVNWRPASSGDRAILERPGRMLTRDDIKPPIWEALIGAGTSSDAELELGAFTAPALPAEAKLQISVQNLELDKLSGRFSAMLDVTADGASPVELRITGRVQEMIDLPVARRHMLPGDVLSAADLDWGHFHSGLVRGELVHLPAEAVGLALKRAISPNEPIALADLGRPTIVHKGDDMVLTLEGPGLSLTAQAVATVPGGLGEHIRVLNAFSRVTLEAEITGPGRGRVIPGTTRPATNLAYAR